MRTPSVAFAGLVALGTAGFAVGALAYEQSPYLDKAVAEEGLPLVDARLPDRPAVVMFNREDVTIGRYGGTLKLPMTRERDIRQMVVYGYARLVGYDRDFKLRPDILERVEVADGFRVFTFYLRSGHRWNDGHPFTAEDFRYYWEDVANDPNLNPSGVPAPLLVDNRPPRFEILSPTVVRYSWAQPNPSFLDDLASANPLYIYRPAHYLKQFHKKYADPKELASRVEALSQRNWVALHYRADRQYKNTNPDLPTLQPWVLATKPPSDSYEFIRNPYFHRVDPEGRQLPYIDKVVMPIVGSSVFTTKVGAGGADLAARNLRFSDASFLKLRQRREPFHVNLWRTGQGAHLALYPNLTVDDPVWRKLLRDPRFRRALSLGINRHVINRVIYFGLALEGNNTVLPESPLYDPDLRRRWAQHDPDRANALLDAMDLTARGDEGYRLLPDGRLLEIIIETAGESTEQTDVIELIKDDWRKIGVKLHSKSWDRGMFRTRVFSGQAVMSIWGGLENGIITPRMSPEPLAPLSQQQLQWPLWGQFEQTGGVSGEPVDMQEALELKALHDGWRRTSDTELRERIWTRMLEIHADQQFTIGLLAGVPQPVVVNERLRNVPRKAIYSWTPGAHFGVYRPDTFWFEPGDMAQARN